MVPSTSDDKTAIYDPHDYDEVAIDEAAVLSRPPAESAVPGPVSAPMPESIPEADDDGLYSEVEPLSLTYVNSVYYTSIV